MIRLILNPNEDSVQYYFDQEEVLIGGEGSATAHVKISGSILKDPHIKIVKERERRFVINAANDPFTSLNGQPFGKKTIKDGDIIQIRDQSLLFQLTDSKEEITSHPAPAPSVKKDFVKDSASDPSPVSPREAPSVSLRKKEIRPPKNFDIEELMREVELLSGGGPAEAELNGGVPSPHVENPAAEAVKEEAPPRPANLDLGDSPPSTKERTNYKRSGIQIDKGDEREKGEKAEEEETANQEGGKPAAGSWRMLTGILLSILTLSTIVCSGVYFRASGKNSQEEKKIAAGIADIAMAMTHAELNRIFPSKQNWSDPDFINTNLACVLSPNLHTQAQIDGRGQFTRYPYLLRVYTSGNMSRFLVIAQPAPNLLQWLVHKKSIVIDSTTMEMRKVADLKQLNRLLANPNPLEGKNGKEISQVVKEGTLMSLASLSGNKNHWGFLPPKALNLIRPGAENYIYNAPRYYPFGESILRKAISLNEKNVTSAEVASLQEEMRETSKCKDMVLYTSQGLQAAIEAQKALTTFTPNSKFIVGYVKFNSKGYVASSHIFMNDERGAIALQDTEGEMYDSLLTDASPLDAQDEGGYAPFSGYSSNGETEPFEDFFTDSLSVDTNHPLFLRLHAIVSSRSRELAPLGDEITQLINRQNKEILTNFRDTLTVLIQEYLELDAMHRTRMVKELAELYQEYSEMPLEEFMSFIEASKLTSFIREALKSHSGQFEDLQDLEADIEQQISYILRVESLAELDDAVQATTESLNLERFPDPEKLIALQESMHNTVVDKLSQLLLSPESGYAHTPLDEQDRTTLARILKSSWATDPVEVDFFLSEFDQLKRNGAR